MMELRNWNLEPQRKPYYFYRIIIFLSTERADNEKTEPFHDYKDFENADLLTCRNEAIEYYKEVIRGIEKNGRFFLPFASPKDFVLGQNANYMVQLLFVQHHDDDDEMEYPLTGDPDEIMEGRELESLVFNELIEEN